MDFNEGIAPEDIICLDIMESGNSIVDFVYSENIRELRVLLDSGKVDINKADKNGRTVVFAAACRGNAEIVNMLLSHGADATATDIHNNTALHWCGHVEIIELLVEYGADVTSRNLAGLTPKDMAERRGVSQHVIEIFNHLEHEAKLKLKQTISPRQDSDSEHNSVPTLFHEFSKEIGGRNLCLLVLGILCLSLYVAWTVTGVSKYFERQENIIVDSSHVKLR